VSVFYSVCDCVLQQQFFLVLRDTSSLLPPNTVCTLNVVSKMLCPHRFETMGRFSPFIYLPFYFVAIYAILMEKEWIRIPCKLFSCGEGTNEYVYSFLYFQLLLI